MASEHPRQYAATVETVWRRWARITAALTGGAAVLTLAAGAAPAGADGAVAVAAAILLLAPGGLASAWARWLGRAAALGLVVAGAAHWLPFAPAPPWGPLAGATAFCYLTLGLSLLLKPLLPSLAVTGDMLVAFVGLAMTLDYVLSTPLVAHRQAVPVMPWPLAVALLLLSGAWMAAFPRLRPVSFFLERTSAGAVLRRLLPVTLLYPVLLVVLSSLRSHDHPTAALVTQAVILYGTVVFGAVLFWLIARLLDRRDALAAAADAELRASERRYRQLFENNPQPMWIFDTDSLAFLNVNLAAERRYGYTQDEFRRMTLLDIRPPEEAAAVRRELEAGSDGSGRLWHHVTREGRDVWAEVFSQLVDWRGHPARMSIVLDVTERMAAEAQVRALMDSTTEGILAVDAGGRCIWCNPAALQLLGMDSPDGLLGASLHQRVHHTRADGSPYPEAECEMLLATRQGRAGAGDEDLFWRADGASFYADWRSVPLRGQAGAGAVITFRDVTERRNLRRQFQQAQKMEAVGRLAAGIAHDFNNLLTVINGYTELLLSQPAEAHGGGAQARARVAGIRKAGERAAGLTKQLLAFSRQQVLEPRLLDLNAVVAEMEPMLRRILGEDLKLATALSPGLGTVRADPGQIGQVLMNLVVNARDAMPDGGTLTIETSAITLDERYAVEHPDVTPGEHVMLAVTDTGTGMDAVTLSHIFEPFFTTKPAGQGTGLGLATVFGIARQSGGSVGVYSELGHGTTFKLYLPRFAAAAADEEQAASASAPGGHETVLLVEDEDTVRELTEEILRMSGYNLLVAALPSDGIRLAQEHNGRIDLLISDVIMPGMGGRQLAEAVKAAQPAAAVLFVSGYPEQAVARTGTMESGVAFLQKPFTPERLTAKVRAVLDGRAAAAGA